MVTADDVIEVFEFLDGWEERYRYLIDLGRKLPDMPAADKTEANRVQGCISMVWMTSQVVSEDAGEVLAFQADSDSAIVKGLIGLLMEIYSGRAPQYILDTDIGGLFEKIGFEEHLSTNRRNGFYSMVSRIQREAQEAL